MFAISIRVWILTLGFIMGLGSPCLAASGSGAIHSFSNTQFLGGAPDINAAMFDAYRLSPFGDSSVCASDTENALITYTLVLPVHPKNDEFDGNEVCGEDLEDCCAGVPFCDLVEMCLADGHPSPVCCFDTDCIDSVSEVKSILSYVDATFTINGDSPQMAYRHPESGGTMFEYRIFPNFDAAGSSCDGLYEQHGIERPQNGHCYSVTISAEPGMLDPGEYIIHTEAKGDIFGPYEVTLTVLDC